MNHTHPLLRAVLKSQYHASLAMLREAIERCPPEEWLSTNHKNAFWQVSYHTLFFAHLYLQHDEAAFRLWEQHRGEGDGIAGEPYAQAQVIEYWEFCDRMIDDAVDALDDHQRQGIGQELVREGLKAIKALGAEGCALVGDPAYYSRFGFTHAQELMFEGVPPEFCMFLATTERMPRGAIAHHPAFSVTA